jgi:hypothetical protein
VGDVGVAYLAQRQALLRRRFHLAHEPTQLLLSLSLRQSLPGAGPTFAPTFRLTWWGPMRHLAYHDPRWMNNDPDP